MRNWEIRRGISLGSGINKVVRGGYGMVYFGVVIISFVDWSGVVVIGVLEISVLNIHRGGRVFRDIGV